MTPAARIAAAIELLDAVQAGQPAEQALSRWARGNRYAGSKDRAAIRDHVFDALRCRRSFAWMGGGDSGRAVMLGACRATGTEDLFDGSTYGPTRPNDDEVGQPLESAPRGVQLDTPDWLLPHFDAALDDADAVMAQQRHRAGVFLRVNMQRATPQEAQAALASEGIDCDLVQNIKTALHVTVNTRKITQSQAFQSGLVEVQDPASQAAVLRLPLADGMRVLDLCAGGGGKSLAMAGLADLQIVAHDIDARRMVDIAPRAARAGVVIEITDTPEGPFDLVLVDAPCSGSGTWRRSPQAKWALTPERLSDLMQIQDEVLDRAEGLTASGGVLAYATCSVFAVENEDRSAALLARHPNLVQQDKMRLAPSSMHDGFYLSVMSEPR